MEHCDRLDEHHRKADQSHRKYEENQKKIKAALEKKRKKEAEMGGNVNAPASRVMPKLKYKYHMNEPFVGGVTAKFQLSHDANIHKHRVACDYDVE